MFKDNFNDCINMIIGIEKQIDNHASKLLYADIIRKINNSEYHNKTVFINEINIYVESLLITLQKLFATNKVEYKDVLEMLSLCRGTLNIIDTNYRYPINTDNTEYYSMMKIRGSIYSKSIYAEYLMHLFRIKQYLLQDLSNLKKEIEIKSTDIDNHSYYNNLINNSLKIIQGERIAYEYNLNEIRDKYFESIKESYEQCQKELFNIWLTNLRLTNLNNEFKP